MFRGICVIQKIFHLIVLSVLFIVKLTVLDFAMFNLLSPAVSVSNTTDFYKTTVSSGIESFESKLNGGYELQCWNSVHNMEAELECRCSGSSLVRIPQILPVTVQSLTIVSAGIQTLRVAGLRLYSQNLKDLTLTDLPNFRGIEPRAFENMNQLRTIYISQAPNLQSLSADVFEGISKSLKILRILNCGLEKIPDLSYLYSDVILQMVDLEGNRISKIEEKSVRVKTEQLILDNNDLRFVEDSAFEGSEIATLSLKGNRELVKMHDLAFQGIVSIQELDLSSTSLEVIPTDGLGGLEILRIQNTHSLKVIPSVYKFKSLREAWLTHHFHCCAFKFPSRHDPQNHAKMQKHLSLLQKKCQGLTHHESSSEEWHAKRKRALGHPRGRWRRELADNSTGRSYDRLLSSEEGSNSNSYEQNEGEFGVFHDDSADVSPHLQATCGNLTQEKIDIKCFPIPDALNPCEDVMGSHWLRGSVWIVVLLAVFGNTAVLIVLFSNRSDVTVPKFLMSNLAFADLCMGFYLLLIAAIDAHSMGEYFNFAYDWQYGSGCKAAGFLTVFASHLSVFTLTIITIERWFAITYAIYLNKRIKLRAAANIMIGGWVFSTVMAGLPLLGISNYSSTSICLPMEARDSYDVSYLITVLAINGLAFVIIVICYAQIYYSLGKETRQAARNASSGEMTITKKMALLIFTNFACWSPIAFFGLTALAGYPLIDVAKSKIILVFFYPLNSCANPYLYAILTSQYRRDLYILLSRCGFCKRRAMEYKLTYSVATQNTFPLIARNSLPEAQSRKSSRGIASEIFV
ncbi:lutropin-choriogonadotropic hormone receptor [Phlebotomus argentipes]|uniref:lutropin-choriogonadotropic hormone receptor n=1 Tax=Phlebotomus argentipes TaxID=94469 RepID=UPI0028937A2E|nr:lutropin-choriogonadotropic hormone receptor [Phlebotomus argentipes]XP_059609437.1 lutropin-choriogonadotropic hormone receptor [Phlebotomus argentipes]XP_059609438.1 lutropin-choriogonadotropic hormone receptor [Phlebotomus argentipes]XP_059609439.1 lutropin-choriogonadotropic hormone receptor [Phlebotomus argentipes]